MGRPISGRAVRPGMTPEELLGARISTRRVALGLSQQQLTRQLIDGGWPICHSTVAKIEAGTSPVGVLQALILADVLETTIEALVRPQASKRLPAAYVAEEVAFMLAAGESVTSICEQLNRSPVAVLQSLRTAGAPREHRLLVEAEVRACDLWVSA